MKERTNLYIDSKVKQKAQIKCVKVKKSLSKIVEDLLKEFNK